MAQANSEALNFGRQTGGWPEHVPLAAHIRRVLDQRPGHRAPAARFLRELEDHLSESKAQRVLDTVINWGLHAEIFSYDSDTEVLSLENF